MDVKLNRTKAPAFRISPHQKQKRYSPFKQRSCDVSEFKSNIDYMRDGNAQIVKTRVVNFLMLKSAFLFYLFYFFKIQRIIDYGDKNHSDQRPLNYKSITAGSAINTKLVFINHFSALIIILKWHIKFTFIDNKQR